MTTCRLNQFTLENLAGGSATECITRAEGCVWLQQVNQTTAEGGAQAKEYLAIYAADRVRTTASVWLGGDTRLRPMP